MSEYRIVVIANACQTINETLDAFKFYSDDKEIVERNNQFYMKRYEEMIPYVGGERRELIDAINFYRKNNNLETFINENNSSSLNGVYLYQFLTDAGYAGRVDLVDNIDLETDRVRELVESSKYVILSTTFITSCFAIVRIAKTLNSWNPDVKIIVGGAKLTQIYDETELHEAARVVDALIISRNGQSALLELIRRFDSGEDIRDVNSIAYYNGRYVRTESQDEKYEMNRCAIKWDEMPDYILRSSVNVQTGRGCPYKCKFCTFPRYNSQKLELKSGDVIFNELQRIDSLPGVRSVRFVDDTLFLNKNRLINFCKKLIDMEFKLPWTAYLRVSTINRETARYLARAGCNLVLLGVEAVDQNILDLMHKGTKEVENWNAAKYLAEEGILVYAFILLGFPGENRETIKKNIDYLNNSGVHAYVHSPLFVFPNTSLSLEAESFGLVGGFVDWKHSGMSCIEAIEYSMELFESVTNAAYIDRGSTVTKIMLDHDYDKESIKKLGILHNLMAKTVDEKSEEYNKYSREFEKLSLLGAGDRNKDRDILGYSSTYSRIRTE